MGCSVSQLDENADEDDDTVVDTKDYCPHTRINARVNFQGCSSQQQLRLDSEDEDSMLPPLPDMEANPEATVGACGLGFGFAEVGLLLSLAALRPTRRHHQ